MCHVEHLTARRQADLRVHGSFLYGLRLACLAACGSAHFLSAQSLIQGRATLGLSNGHRVWQAVEFLPPRKWDRRALDAHRSPRRMRLSSWYLQPDRHIRDPFSLGDATSEDILMFEGKLACGLRRSLIR